jgi:hypothetical protein
MDAEVRCRAEESNRKWCGGSRIYRNIHVVSLIARQQENLKNGYHGYHESSHDEFGLQVDSTKIFSHRVAIYKNVCHCLKQEGLGMVARDGIEPPTPAFSGLASPADILFTPWKFHPFSCFPRAELLEPIGTSISSPGARAPSDY